ncbi:MAG: 30S ribosomal protein S3 [Candidatus Omnitrophica bacterium]|nr:30S ribosomal protein S3 [Candidatus Omnitrophota bacterium]MBU4140629.1 30S ribosomal protein S3 [Candidatus Omnitrophota bacterium]
MGQKVHPYALRLGFIKGWKSSWFSKKNDFPLLLHEDFRIRKYIKAAFSTAGVSSIEIERASGRVRIVLHTSRPGVIIGRRGADIDRLRDELQDITGKQIFVDIKEIKKPALDAQLVAENVAFQLEKRIAFRRAMKKAIQITMGAGAEGVKIACSGRLGGAEMSRREGYHEGKLPLQTFRADIDYGISIANTAYGTIGVKVWIYKGDVYPQKKVGKDGIDAKKS